MKTNRRKLKNTLLNFLAIKNKLKKLKCNWYKNLPSLIKVLEKKVEKYNKINKGL